jgi:hypothetical protein
MARIQIKRGLAASWTSVNPLLAAGEFGFETDTAKLKVGNGLVYWNDLSYLPVSTVGPTGATGPTGPAGADGPTGAAGATGASGADGQIGPTGATGPTGPAGADGASGPTGATGATGASGADGQIENTSYTTTIGNGSSTAITVTHNLGSRNVVVSVKDASTYVEVECDVAATTTNAVTLTFATAPTAGQYTVTVFSDGIYAAPTTLNWLSSSTIKDDTDQTKQVRFDVSGVSTGTTRTLVAPNANTTIVGTDTTQTLTNKTVIDPFTTTVTSGGTTTLTAESAKIQEFTGSANHTLVLPTTGVSAGQQFIVINNSTGTITGLASNSSQIHVLGPNVECVFTALVNTPTIPAHWEDSFYGASFAAGKALTVNSTITLAGTDGTTMTFPGASDTVVTIAATQGLTNKTLTNPTVTNYTESVNAVGTVTSTATLSLATGTVLTATLTASTACAFTMPTVGAGKSFILMLKQAASTGGGTATFINVKWGTSGAPTITATAGKMDILSFVSDGTSWFGSVSAGYTP